MGRKTETQRLTESILGQHLALSVAAGLARTQLIPDPLRVYDAQHLSDMLNAVAQALAKVAPLYFQESKTGAARELTQDELQGAEMRRGATLVVLKDGRALSSVSIKRADLRQAIAILRTIGIHELVPPAAAQTAPPRPPDPFDALGCLAQIEELLRGPLVAPQVEKASSLAVALARRSPQGHVANLSMQLVSAVHEARSDEAEHPERVKLALARLRAALEEGQAAKR